MSLFGTPVVNYPLIYPTLDVTGQTDSTPVLMAAQAALQNLGQWGTIVLPPTPFGQGIQLNDFPWYPWFNLKGSGKLATRVFANHATTAVIISKARLTTYTGGFPGWQTLAPEISDMEVDANGQIDYRTLANGGTGNGIHGIYVPNAQNDDPNYSLTGDTSKSYSSIRARRITVHGGGRPSSDGVNFPNANGGGGIISEANRHRFYSEDAFVTSNNWHGIKIGGADPVVGPRTGCGSNGYQGIGHSILASAGTDLIMCGVNCWGTGAQRSDNSLAFFTTSTNGCLCVGCVFNDTISLTGSANQDRSVNITGCQFRPNAGNFTANGVPAGTGTGATNAFIHVDKLDVVTISSCDFNCTSKNAWTYLHLLNARNGAHVAFFHCYNSSAVNQERPWASTDSIPFTVDQDGSGNPTSWVIGLGLDMSAELPGFRLGGLGYETIGLNVGNNDLDPTMSVMIADPNNRPLQIKIPVIFTDRLCVSYLRINVANSGAYTIPKNVYKFLLGGGGAHTNVGITMPDNPLNGHLVRVCTYNGTSITSGMTWTAGAGGAGFVGFPNSMTAGQSADLLYSSNDNNWLFS